MGELILSPLVYADSVVWSVFHVELTIIKVARARTPIYLAVSVAFVIPCVDGGWWSWFF